MFVKIKLDHGDNLIIGCMYKNPINTENVRYISKAIYDKGNSKNFTHIWIMGNFNYPKLNWTEWKTGDEVMENIRDSYLSQHVTGYTRTRVGCEPSIID